MVINLFCYLYFTKPDAKIQKVFHIRKRERARARFLLYFRQFLHMDTPTNGTDETDFILLYKPKKLEKNDYCFIVLRTSNLRSDNLFLNRFNITYPTKASLQRVIKQ